MKKRIINYRGIICLYIMMCSCTLKSVVKQSYSTNRISPRDSIYVMFTVRSWAGSNFDLYHDYSKEGYGLNQYEILRTFYSSDSLKMICWISIKRPNNPDCKRPQGFSYSSTDVICFRDHINGLWKIYPLELKIVICSDNEGNLLDQLEQYYLVQMKDRSEYVNKLFLNKSYGGKVRYDFEEETIKDGYNNKNSPLILKDYGYNLLDEKFWTNSLIWQKGARIPGLYNFQTAGNVTPDENDVRLLTPKVNYPDSIIKMFNSSK